VPGPLSAGLYQTEQSVEERKPTDWSQRHRMASRAFLRFYLDGRVISVTSATGPAYRDEKLEDVKTTSVAKWFAYEVGRFSGRYKLSGQAIKFVTWQDSDETGDPLEWTGSFSSDFRRLDVVILTRRETYTIVPIDGMS
jgi:hypothetical protein